MIINNLLDIIEVGFKWNGSCYICGFYRIKENNNYLYLEKFKGYKYKRPVYDEIYSIFINPNKYSWIEYYVNENEFIKFKNAIKNATRDTKLKRLGKYFKQSEYYYSHLHSINI